MKSKRKAKQSIKHYSENENNNISEDTPPKLNKKNIDSREGSDSECETDYTETAKQASLKLKTTAISSNKHLLELKETLGLEEFKQRKCLKAAKRRRQKERKRLKKMLVNSNTNKDIVETLATKMGKGDQVIPEVVVYQDPRKRKRQKSKNDNVTSQGSQTREKGDKDEEVTMKEARFDVFKFGARGLDKKGQHDARVALALSLGAKPLKDKCLPYEQFKEQKRKEKEVEKKEIEQKRISGLLKPSKRSHKSLKTQKRSKIQSTVKASLSRGKNKGAKKSGTSTGGGGIQPKLGKFDGGMLKLSAKDIAKLKGNK